MIVILTKASRNSKGNWALARSEIERTLQLLVGLGGIFTTWLFVRGFSEGMKEPMIMLFLITLIFCSVAVGMFFVVLNIIVNLMIRIAKNTDRKAD